MIVLAIKKVSSLTYFEFRSTSDGRLYTRSCVSIQERMDHAHVISALPADLIWKKLVPPLGTVTSRRLRGLTFAPCK